MGIVYCRGRALFSVSTSNIGTEKGTISHSVGQPGFNKNPLRTSPKGLHSFQNAKEFGRILGQLAYRACTEHATVFFSFIKQHLADGISYGKCKLRVAFKDIRFKSIASDRIVFCIKKVPHINCGYKGRNFSVPYKANLS